MFFMKICAPGLSCEGGKSYEGSPQIDQTQGGHCQTPQKLCEVTSKVDRATSYELVCSFLDADAPVSLTMASCVIVVDVATLMYFTLLL